MFPLISKGSYKGRIFYLSDFCYFDGFLFFGDKNFIFVYLSFLYGLLGVDGKDC